MDRTSAGNTFDLHIELGQLDPVIVENPPIDEHLKSVRLKKPLQPRYEFLQIFARVSFHHLNAPSWC